MKDYLKAMKRSIIHMMTSLAMLVLFSAYVGLFLFLFTLSELVAIPFIIITIFLICFIESCVEDNSMENYWTYVIVILLTTIMLVISISVIIGILSLMIFLLRISFWFAIPIFIVIFLIYTYIKYKEDKK